jgi:hypothetical protein
MLYILASLLVSAQAFAAPSYYKGEQPIGIAGETTECFVETEYVNQGQSVKIRSLTTDLHDGELFGSGPIEAAYQAQNHGYNFAASDDHDKLQQLFLTAHLLSQPESLDITVLDGSHADTIQCLGLRTVSISELEMIKEKFENFDDYTGDGDHDHHNH